MVCMNLYNNNSRSSNSGNRSGKEEKETRKYIGKKDLHNVHYYSLNSLLLLKMKKYTHTYTHTTDSNEQASKGKETKL